MARMVEAPRYTVASEVSLNPHRTAVIVVDMQNDFAKPEGKLHVPTAQTIVGPIARLLARAREVGVFIIYTQDTHGERDPEYRIWGEHARAGTWGADIIAELAPRPGDEIVQKPRYDAFYASRMEDVLRSHPAIDTLIITGTVTNICVLHTAGSAALRWYKLVVPKDAVAALSEFDQEAALHQIDFLYKGTITTVDAIRFDSSTD
ncbi:MAG: cysteine hydrolase [Anaerolineae bacterium]|nr:cysteine hydrolase [Anaerolineae bacterium]